LEEWGEEAIGTVLNPVFSRVSVARSIFKGAAASISPESHLGPCEINFSGD
jgi:hypothetical protein